MGPFVDPLHLELPKAWASNGCFETMRAYGGRIFRLEDHLERLYASATSLGTRVEVDRRHVGRRLRTALKRSGLNEAVVRIALIPPPFASPKANIGPAGRAKGGGIIPRREEPASPSIVVQPATRPPASAYRRGAQVAIVPARKFAVGSINPQAKYSARLGSVLAVIDARLRGVDEALFLDEAGSVTESTASNFGIVSKEAVLTPPCWLGLLTGITREVLFELAQELRLQIREVPLTRHDLYNADEAFLTSTLKEVLPVTSIDGRRIGTGRPGPITKRLHRAFQRLVKRELHIN
ncbi:MAG: aminotransferase class IV [Candidatus Omnitrophica bacterium]|nr:aminotransferase class IV [Candidatus Omnitrophota bacterium]